MTLTLRPYQREAIEAVTHAWQSHRSALVVLPTGTGKTATASQLITETGGRWLWVAHRDELLIQASQAIGRCGVTTELEQGSNRAIVHRHMGGAQVVVASVATMHARRLRRWPIEAFSHIVIDEAHHAPARTYRAILNHFGDAKVLGLTATPDRGDGLAMGECFDVAAYQYEILDAIEAGYLAPIRAKVASIGDISLDSVRTVAGDLHAGQLEALLNREQVHHAIALPMVELASDRQSIVFAAGVDQATDLAAVISGYGIPAEVITGSTPKDIRAERLQRFRDGELRALVNVAVLTEGTDLPNASCVVIARPTKSRALYTQMVGRGLRIAPGKADCLVIDCTGTGTRHSLCSPMDVLAGKLIEDDVVRDRVRQLESEGAPSHDALARAQAERVERERRAEEERARRAKIVAKARVRAQSWDPFGATSSVESSGQRPTDRQLKQLRRMGLDDKTLSRIDRESAATMSEWLSERRKAGQATYKQAKILAQHGLPLDVSVQVASRMIDIIAAARWRPSPAEVARCREIARAVDSAAAQ